jgi:DNA (cytosine-5)-methyltransferase 1
MSPRLLETHACQGGATDGYRRAGWDVTAVDVNKNHTKYNPARLILADAATYIRDHGHEYDAIHASPPCQWYTRGNAARRGQDSKWERSIPAIREALESTGRPYVIENVKDAAWDMREPITLCGCMFDLSVRDYGCTATERDDIVEHVLTGACNPRDGITVHLQRPRLFETNWGLTAPRPCDHGSHEWVAGAYGGARRDKYEAKYIRKGGYVPPSKDVVKALLGVEHDMTWNGLFECLPPAYTEYVGTLLKARAGAVQ